MSAKIERLEFVAITGELKAATNDSTSNEKPVSLPDPRFPLSFFGHPAKFSNQNYNPYTMSRRTIFTGRRI